MFWNRLMIVFLPIIFFQAYVAAENIVLDSSLVDYQPLKGKLPALPSTLQMDIELGMPISESTVPSFSLRFPGTKQENLATIVVADELCTGEYKVNITYLPSKNQVATAYTNNGSPWPETIELLFMANTERENGYEHILKINNEVKRFTTKKKLRKYEIDAQGSAEIENYKIIKEGTQ